MKKKRRFNNGNDWWESLSEPHKTRLEGSIVYDDYFDAIMGYAKLPDGNYVLVYDADKCIDELNRNFAKDNPDDPADNALDMAVEYFSFNVEGLWAGVRTPLLLGRDIDDQALGEMREPLPGFVGYATRCSDQQYAVFPVEVGVGRFITIIDPDNPKKKIKVPVVRLIEL